MGEIDTQLLKLYDNEPLFLSEVIQDDAELLLLDTWLMETLFTKWKLKSEKWKVKSESNAARRFY